MVKGVRKPSWRHTIFKQLALMVLSTLAALLATVLPDHPMSVYVIARGCVYAVS